MKRKIKPTDQNRPCYQHIINESKNSIDILLHDEIGFWGTQSKDFVKLLKDNKNRVLNIDINSPGGSVTDGFSIFNSIKSHPSVVNIKVSGVAASIAAFITLAADKANREMSENSMIMFHKPYMGAFGTVDEISAQVEALQKFEDRIFDTLQKNVSISDKDVVSNFAKDWWITSDEAVDTGLISAENITDTVEVSNFFDLDSYKYKDVPENARKLVDVNYTDSSTGLFTRVKNKFYNKPQTKEEEMEIKDLEKKLTEVTNRIDTLENTIKEKDLVIEDQKKTIENIKNSTANIEKDRRSEKFSEMVDKYVSTGKIKPVDRDIHIKNLEMRYSEKDTEMVDAYNKYMDSLEVVVDLSPDHIANKNSAQNKSEQGEKLLEEEIKKVMDSNKNMSYANAARVARENITNK